MELFAAHKQWSTRPEDEKFASIETAHAQSKHYYQHSNEKSNINPATLRAQALDGEVKLVGRGDKPVDLTHFAFGQLARNIEAPASYLRSLPATLAAQNINHGLVSAYGTATEPRKDNRGVTILAHSNGKNVVRAITSDRYARVWNYEVFERLLGFKQYGWDTPVAFEYANGQANPEGKHEESIYVSDHDMFAFLVNNNFRLKEVGNATGLGRGFFVSNSEVGAGALKVTTFLYRYVCCNHIVWGAKEVAKLSLRHIGDIRSKFRQFAATLERYANSSASDDEAKIASAQTTVLGGTKDEVLDEVFRRLRGEQITQKTIERGLDLAFQNETTDGNPYSVWGVAQGITRASQEVPYADERARIDNAAGKLLSAF